MNISKGNTTELKQAVAQYGPVSVLISTQPKSFKFYSSGVYYDPECGKSCFVEKYIYKAPLKRKWNENQVCFISKISSKR